jgi:hypothetical protein
MRRRTTDQAGIAGHSANKRNLTVKKATITEHPHMANNNKGAMLHNLGITPRNKEHMLLSKDPILRVNMLLRANTSHNQSKHINLNNNLRASSILISKREHMGL